MTGRRPPPAGTPDRFDPETGPGRTAAGAAGPWVVALGGGHGLAATLTAARSYAGRLTGVVSVGDDGGSSGRLRAELGLPAVGDIRRCLSALAGDESLFTRSLEHRFETGPLAGHAVGNLLLAGLTMAGGDLAVAVAEVARLIGATGQLYPATTAPVTLVADSDAGLLVGQVTIERATGIRDLRVDPADPEVAAGAVHAIEEADQIILGPGSLFTSVLATAVVPAIREAVGRTRGQRVYVANVATTIGEAYGFGLVQHLEAITAHGVEVDVVVAPHDAADLDAVEVPVVTASLAALDGWGHDPVALGKVLSTLL